MQVADEAIQNADPWRLLQDLPSAPKLVQVGLLPPLILSKISGSVVLIPFRFVGFTTSRVRPGRRPHME